MVELFGRLSRKGLSGMSMPSSLGVLFKSLTKVTLGLLVTGFASAAPIYSTNPYTVEELLKLEGVGRAVLLPDGKRAIFEKYLSYSSMSAFGGVVRDRSRSRLYITCLAANCRPEPLLPSLSQSGQWIASVSPSGSKIAFYTLTNGELALGVYDFSRHALKSFEVSPYFAPISRFNEPIWEDDENMILPIAPVGRQAPSVVGEQGAAKMISSLYRQNWEQKALTVTAIKSGYPNANSNPAPMGELIRIDLSTDEILPIIDGSFVEASYSPDGSHLALLRDKGRALPNPGDPIVVGEPLAAQQLVVVEKENRNDILYHCENCSIATDTLQWNEDGTKLMFFGRMGGEPWQKATYYILDTASWTASEILPEGINVYRPQGQEAPLPTKGFWLDGSPVVFGQLGDEGRSDWYKILDGSASSVTSEMRSPPSAFLYNRDGEVYFWADGGLWVLRAGQLKAKKIHVDVLANGKWTPSQVASFDGKQSAYVVSGTLILSSQEPLINRSIMLLDLGTYDYSKVRMPDSGAKMLDIDLVNGREIFLTQTNKKQALTVTKRGRAEFEILSFNRHLESIAAPGVLSIRYNNEESRSLNGFLLLPANREESERLPVIVYVYPWQLHGKSWSDRPYDQMWSANSLNMQILAGAGFAVLFPSTPAAPLGEKQDLMESFPENVVSALECADELGFVDASRAGIFGTSYGSYVAAGTIAQTDRFRAAVTTAHTKLDLFSFFAGINESTRGQPSDVYPFYRWGYTEGFIRNPPWLDAESYIQNSPLSFVDNIDTPWLLVQGDLDSGGGLQQAEEAFSALVRAGKEAELVRYWGEGHGIYGEANLRDMWERILSFYGHRLGLKDSEKGSFRSFEHPMREAGACSINQETVH